MPTTVYTNNQYYSDIAAAIRSKNGQTTSYKPSEMAGAIQQLAGGTISLQNRTVTSSTVSQTITASSGYAGLGTVTINAINTVTLATPEIGINSSGLITALVEQDTAGYIVTSSTSTTHQLTVRTATTITPKSSAQVAVSPGYYATGTVTVAAVPTETKNITANGTYAPSSGKWFSSVTVNVASGASINNENITVTPNETVQTFSASSGYTGLGTVTVNAISSTYVGSGITTRSSTDLTASGASVTVPAGYYSAQASKSVATVTQATPAATIANATGIISATATQSAGYVTAGTKTGTAQLTVQTGTTITPKATAQTAVAAYRWTTGTITVAAVPTDTNNSFSSNGTYTPASGKWFDSVTIDIASGVNNQAKTVNSSTATQTVKPDSGYSGLSQVTVNAMGVSTITNGVLNVATVTEANNDYGVEASITIPAGYYNTTTLSRVLSNILPAPATAAATPQILSAYEAYDYQGKLLVGTMTNRGTWNATLSDTVTSTTIPAGYHSGSGKVSIATVSIPAPTFTFAPTTGVVTASSNGNWTKGFTTNNNYSNTYTVPLMTVPTATSASSSGTRKITVTPATTSQYINLPTGYNTASAYFQINAMAAGSATPPATISGTEATITVGNNILTFSKSISLTPQVTAGYISAGTAASRTVSLSATVTTKAAATYTPSTATQTIAANQYLAGAQTIAPIPSDYITTDDATATAGDIVEGETAYVDGRKLTGNLVINRYYTGSAAPTSALGDNGDIYFQS